MSTVKRQRISAEDAVQNILQFIEEKSGDEDSDLDELYSDEADIDFDNEAVTNKEALESD